MSAQHEIDILQAVRSGDEVDLHKALAARDREASMGTCGYDPYEDLQDLPEPPRNRRQAKIQELEQKIQVLQGRIYARDATIDSLRARVAQLQEIIANKSMTPAGCMPAGATKIDQDQHPAL